MFRDTEKIFHKLKKKMIMVIFFTFYFSLFT
jgi:hypothetical protein